LRLFSIRFCIGVHIIRGLLTLNGVGIRIYKIIDPFILVVPLFRIVVPVTRVPIKLDPRVCYGHARWEVVVFRAAGCGCVKLILRPKQYCSTPSECARLSRRG
jgi:hypothetical protein